METGFTETGPRMAARFRDSRRSRIWRGELCADWLSVQIPIPFVRSRSRKRVFRIVRPSIAFGVAGYGLWSTTIPESFGAVFTVSPVAGIFGRRK